MSIFSADKKFERFEDVTPALLKKEGVKLLLCDLDNTLSLMYLNNLSSYLLRSLIGRRRVRNVRVRGDRQNRLMRLHR